MAKNSERKGLKWHLNLTWRGLRLMAAFPKPLLLSRACTNIASAAVPFINIWFSAQILNELAGARQQDRLVMLVLLTIGLNLLGALLVHASARWMAHSDSPMFSILMNQPILEKLLKMDYIDIENPKIQEDLAAIRQHQNMMGFGLPRLIWHYDSMIDGLIKIILSIAFTVTLFTLQVPEYSTLAFLNSGWVIFGVCVLLIASFTIAPYLSYIGGKIWIPFSEKINVANRILEFYLYHMTQGTARAKDIRIYDQNRLIHKGAKYMLTFSRIWLEDARYNARYNAISAIITHLANGMIYLFVVLKAFAGAFGVGSIIRYVGAVTQFGSGFSTILTHIGLLTNNNTYLENLTDFLDIPNEKQQGDLKIDKDAHHHYEIEFKNVSFKYPGSDSYALKDLSLKMKVGQRLAVVGMNGSGKTTMIKLLCRLYDPTHGEILLNGTNIKAYNYDDYMAIFGVVFQDFALLPFTLGQNVASNFNYDEERVKRALHQSGFEDCLKEMPHGLDTYLYKHFEETGVEVSGGEAQKIALARALYKNTPFIILDEPTAALDPIAEYEIYSRFNEMVGDKTAVYISHRLSSCRFCDDIVVFHEGQLIQRGSHEQLVADELGKYHELWNAQAQYYTDEG